MSCPALDNMFSYAADNYAAATETTPGVNVVANVTLEVTGRLDNLTWYGSGAGQMWYTPGRFEGFPLPDPALDPQFFLIPAQFTISGLAMEWYANEILHPPFPQLQPLQPPGWPVERTGKSLAFLAVVAPHVTVLPPGASYAMVANGAVAGSTDANFSQLIDGQLTPQCGPGYVWGPNPTTAGSVTLIIGDMATYPFPSLGD
jgi:hypothetical protein